MHSEVRHPHIKKIPIEQLKPGMFVHDLNCGWLDHDFLTNRFEVKDGKTLFEIHKLGVHELYIDTQRGLDVADAPTEDEVQEQIEAELEAIAHESASFKTVDLAEEIHRAGKLHAEANQIAQRVLSGLRVGEQIEFEEVAEVVDGMVESIFRNQDALLPLSRLKRHDTYTFQHSVATCIQMIAFARRLKMPRQAIHEVAIGALLHDVGKSKIPDEILNKPAKLTDAEFEKIKSHVVQSLILLQHTPGISQAVLDVAGQHHERYDGTGYPNKLKGEQISFHGQMGAIVDVYDALTSERAYHKGMPPTQALGKLLEWSKFHFSPELVRIYIKSMGIYPTGSLVRLESGRLGVVTEQHPEKSMQPVVKIFYDAIRDHYIEPRTTDLAKPGCQDRIVGHEHFEAWGIDPRKWLPG